jgi:serine/threonine protein kinase
VEPLTPTYDLTTHWTDEIARNAIASSLDAFKKTIGRLEEYYQTLPLAPPVVRTFPYPTSYKDKRGQEIKFTYRSRIDEKLVFRASVDGDVKNNSLCVKFTKRYSENAHQFLANLGYAPQLREVTSLPGGWTMVIMDFSPYAQLAELFMPSVESPRFVKSKIRDIVQKLHDNGFVHGDIRENNILVDPETLASKDDCAVHLIDFDWAGKDQEVRYLGRVNTLTVRRPNGVSDGELITKSHDMEMVSLLLPFCSYFTLFCPSCFSNVTLVSIL